ncbi:hypothetical protein GCM10009715_08270 [Paeniglutamicibacter psychrophenolicus]|uniref:Sulfur relay (Sulfurtransferase) complex TusBCD TusD component (DsrE family) n=1 Tax=Paeniglutamicibacter psychrophenolicus TaxID=257454 RepID=A0ABS4WFF9_9MICC|nr:hypothetical protein [Paeniglutamicibacter psychrophenolicus]MBP2374931.1 sulfur relay (sulfurtransferase) complex TusBCD TusD component (DsrE family) [Paeniglutamicibacter psychrophenolicus]
MVDYRRLTLVAGVVVAVCALAMLRRGHTAVAGAQDTTAAAGAEKQQHPR